MTPAGAGSVWQTTHQYDSTGRLLSTGGVGTSTLPGSIELGAEWAWGGATRLYAMTTRGALGTGVRYGYHEGRGPAAPSSSTPGSAWKLGRMSWGATAGTSATAAPGVSWGDFGYGWRGHAGASSDGAKIGREVLGDASEVGAFSDLGWAWQYDNGVRLATAQSGTGRMAGFDPEVAADGERYVYDYGTGDELLSETRQQAGETVSFEAGDYGRPISRNGEPFTYDAVGRRLEDDRFVYRWDWRGQLVSVEIKDTWPDGETSPYAGHRIRYDYDARGRLTSRLHEGPAAAGGTRPFVEERRYVWEHDRLAAEAAYGLGETGEYLRWRRTYVPGPSGLDDPTQVVVEILQPGSPFSGQARTYTYLRDELGTVVGLVAEPPPGEPVDVLRPPIPVRYLYTPYGEAHAETGPELRRAHFDADAIRSTNGAQTIDDPKLAAAGAMVLRWSLPLEPSTLETELRVERFQAGSGWTEVPRAEYVVAPPPAGESQNAAVLRVLPLTGWTRGATYRVHLGADLRDHLGRPFGHTEDLEWNIPAIPPDAPEDAEPPPIGFDKSFPLRFESYQAASNTLGGRFPTGQSRLFQGLWTDPVTGISYARARWYDARNATWLAEDPLFDIDSPNLYAFVGWQPSMGRDPLGLVCPTCTKQHIRDDQAEEAKRQREQLESLLFETQWFLAENEFSNHEQALTALSEHLEGRGFASGHRFESLRLAAQLIGPADCDGSNQVVCHLGGGREFAEALEWGVVTAASFLIPEMALTELAAGGTSYVAMLQSVQADVRFARVLRNVQASQRARMASNFGAHVAREMQALGGYRPDVWRMVNVEEGGIVYGATPGQTAFYTDFATSQASGLRAAELYNSLQIRPHPVFGYRTGLTAYRVKKTSRVPAGFIEANPELGFGGGYQYLIKNFESALEPIRTFNLSP